MFVFFLVKSNRLSRSKRPDVIKRKSELKVAPASLAQRIGARLRIRALRCYLFVSKKHGFICLCQRGGEKKRNIDLPFPHEPLYHPLPPPFPSSLHPSHPLSTPHPPLSTPPSALCHDITEAVVKPPASDGQGLKSPLTTH